MASPLCRTAFGTIRPGNPVGILLARLVPENAMTRRVAGVMAARPEGRRQSETLRRSIAALLREGGVESDDAVRAFLIRRIRSDFDDGRTIRVDGWHLSATEAGLMFLASEYRPG